MGLGPAVCEKCQVLAELNSNWMWYCSICGNTDPKDSAGFGNWQKYKDNEKFLRFMLNKVNTDES
jgi:hypothetical protein